MATDLDAAGLEALVRADSDDEALVERVIDAPLERVFAMWSQPEHIARWWHPDGFDRVVCENIDVRVGGNFTFRMEHESGVSYLSCNTYREIVPCKRIVYDERCHENGNLFHQARITVTFAAQGDKTVLRIHARFDWVADRDASWTIDVMKLGWTQGWKENFRNLVAHLASLRTPTNNYEDL